MYIFAGIQLQNVYITSLDLNLEQLQTWLHAGRRRRNVDNVFTSSMPDSYTHAKIYITCTTINGLLAFDDLFQKENHYCMTFKYG